MSFSKDDIQHTINTMTVYSQLKRLFELQREDFENFESLDEEVRPPLSEIQTHWCLTITNYVTEVTDSTTFNRDGIDRWEEMIEDISRKDNGTEEVPHLTVIEGGVQ